MNTIYKAETIAGEEIPDLVIEARETVSTAMPLSESMLFYRKQGEEIVRRMRRSLPGGTVHAVLVALLEAKVSLLRVREVDEVKGG